MNLNEENPKHKPLSQLQFRSVLANELIHDFCSKKKVGSKPRMEGQLRKKHAKTGRPTGTNSVRLRNVGEHIPEIGTWRRCAYCSTKKHVKRSNLICKSCQIALCKSCFAAYHSTSP